MPKLQKIISVHILQFGIAGILCFHMLENIGMTMGLLPITGVPLPFVSYGGSSLLTNFICIGLVLNALVLGVRRLYLLNSVKKISVISRR